MLDILLKYNGIDWIAIILTFAQIYYMGNKDPRGFIFGMFASLTWFYFGTIIGSIAVPFAHTILLGLNARGLYKWKKQHEDI